MADVDPLRQLSVIVPVAPGERLWRDLLNDLVPLPEGSEVLLVGPEPIPEAEMAPFAARCLCDVRHVFAPASRAAQMNRAAYESHKQYLWFLRAGAKVPKPTITALRRAFAEDEAAIYFFELQYLDDGPKLMTLNRMGANWRSSFLGLPFGDQGFALSRRQFLRVGGFDENVAYGEDHVFVWEARRKGVPLRRVKAPIFTSARQYEEQGWYKVTSRHMWLTAKQAMSECLKTVKGRLLE